jgi:hypothetical protein
MTVTAMAELGVGERQLRDRQRKFRRLVAAGGLVGGVIGLAVGVTGGLAEGWQRAGGASFGWVLWPVLAVSIAFFARYCVRYFRQVDELDVQDNLWASLIGLYAAIIAYPAWEALYRVGQLPAPTALGVWVSGIVAACVTYIWRKVRHRF